MLLKNGTKKYKMKEGETEWIALSVARNSEHAKQSDRMKTTKQSGTNIVRIAAHWMSHVSIFSVIDQYEHTTKERR